MVLGSLFGVRLRVNPYFLLFLAAYAFLGLLRPVLILVAVVLGHELSHVLVARGYGLAVQEVELLPFGGVARLPTLEGADPFVETTVAMAGPLHNFFLTGLAILLRRWGFLQGELGTFFLEVNLGMACGNFLPALPLDGGRIYRLYLARTLGYRRAGERLVLSGRITAGVLAVGGAAGLVFGVASPTLLVLALFLFFSCRKEATAGMYRAMRDLVDKRRRFQEAGVAGVEHLLVREDLAAAQVLSRLLPGRHHLLWVVDRQLRPQGCLSEAQLLEAMAGEGGWRTVGEILGRHG